MQRIEIIMAALVATLFVSMFVAFVASCMAGNEFGIVYSFAGLGVMFVLAVITISER